MVLGSREAGKPTFWAGCRRGCKILVQNADTRIDADTIHVYTIGGEASLGQRILDALHRRGLSVRMAIADTPGAAWAAAHFDLPQTASDGTPEAACGLARFPGDPNTLSRKRPTIVPSGETLPERVVERLHSVGIHRI